MESPCAKASGDKCWSIGVLEKIFKTLKGFNINNPVWISPQARGMSG